MQLKANGNTIITFCFNPVTHHIGVLTVILNKTCSLKLFYKLSLSLDAMDDVLDLVISPFNDIITRGQIAVENAGDNGPMLKAAQSLIREGERALNKIEPLCRMLLDKHGLKFLDFLNEDGKSLLQIPLWPIVANISSISPNRL